MTVMLVPCYDDLEMAWLYHAQGWECVYRLAGNHGFWSWLVWRK